MSHRHLHRARPFAERSLSGGSARRRVRDRLVGASRARRRSASSRTRRRGADSKNVGTARFKKSYQDAIFDGSFIRPIASPKFYCGVVRFRWYIQLGVNGRPCSVCFLASTSSSNVSEHGVQVGFISRSLRTRRFRNFMYEIAHFFVRSGGLGSFLVDDEITGAHIWFRHFTQLLLAQCDWIHLV